MNLTMLDSLWNKVMGHVSVLTIDVPPFVFLQGGKEFMSMWNVSWNLRKKGIIKINCFSLIGLEYMVTAQTFFACLLQSYQKRTKKKQNQKTKHVTIYSGLRCQKYQTIPLWDDNSSKGLSSRELENWNANEYEAKTPNIVALTVYYESSRLH